MEYNTKTDEQYMRMALSEAADAYEADEVPVGAVVVLDGKVIARGHNLTETLHDVTAHAEMIAITAASGSLGAKYLRGCTLYVTLEPCVMCAGAIAHAQLDRLVYGADDPKRGYTLLGVEVLPGKMKVEKGILAEESAVLLKEFFQEKR